MCEQYKDYGYTSFAPGDKESSVQLADLIISIIAKQGSVSSICDLGCGNGYLANRLADFGYHVLGIDASKSGIDVARSSYRSEKLKFECMKIDSNLSVQVTGSEFDLIVSSDVIEHLYRPSVLIEAAFQLLRPDGHLIITTPYHGYLKNLAIALFNKWDSHMGAHWDGGHIKFFSVKTLRQLVAKHGFRETQFYFYGRLPFLWKNMICHARKGILIR